MAFFQLFSTGLAKGEKKYTRPSSKIELVLVNDNKDNPIYQYQNNETNELKPISIFDEKNKISHQYGANQSVFKIQSIFPWQDFETKEYAKLFYEFYFATISECGCGYAAVTNYVFRLFEGREEEFYNTFGYPMYKVETQYVDFNYEIFMLKFFNYYIKSTNSLNDIKNHVMIKVYQYKLDEYENKKKENRMKFNDFKKMTSEEYHKWEKKNSSYKKIIKKYKEKIKQIPLNDRGYGIPLNTTFGNLVKYLKQYGINIKCQLIKDSKKAKIDDIIASEDYSLSEERLYGIEEYDYSNTGPHYMYITGITDDGKIIVSSWGDMYTFDDQEAKWTTRINIKTLDKH